MPNLFIRSSKGYGVSGKAEADSMQCCHCGNVWWVRSTDNFQETDLGGWCRMCMKPICTSCSDKPCIVFEEQLLRYEQSQRFAKDVGLEM